MGRLCCLPQQATEQTAIEKKVKGGGYERRGVQNSDLSYKCVKHDAALPPFRPEMSLCDAMVTPCVFAEADVTVGSALKRETSV